METYNIKKKTNVHCKAIKINHQQITNVNGVSNKALAKRWIWRTTCLHPVLHFLLYKCLSFEFLACHLSYLHHHQSCSCYSITFVWFMIPQKDQEPVFYSLFSCTSSLNVAAISLSLDAEVLTINIFVKSLCWMLHSAGKEMSQSFCYLRGAKYVPQ